MLTTRTDITVNVTNFVKNYEYVYYINNIIINNNVRIVRKLLKMHLFCFPFMPIVKLTLTN